MINNAFEAWLGEENEQLELSTNASLYGYQFENHTLHIFLEYLMIHICILDDDIIRVNILEKSDNIIEVPLLDDHILMNQPLECLFREEETYLLLKRNQLEIQVNLIYFTISVSKGYDKKFVISGDELYKNIKANDILLKSTKPKFARIYGLGEKTGYLNKNGEQHEMYNTDVYKPHNPDTGCLYQSHPYYILSCGKETYGLFINNPGRSFLNFAKEDEIMLRTVDGPMDLYIYPVDHIKEVVSCHTMVTGKSFLPPKWAIGNHQSRWGYNLEGDMIHIASEYRKKGIPLDVIHFDIPYMDGYRVFTFDRKRFDDPKRLIEQLGEMDIHVVPIVDPGVKQDGNYDVYKAGIANNYFCQMSDGRVYTERVWPGESVFPDFSKVAVRQWWGGLHQFYTDMGIEGIWNDMNEPAVIGNESGTIADDVLFDFDGRKVKHKAVHNLYGFLMSKATKEHMDQLINRRSFVLTRAGYPGIQRFAAVWTGDNRSFWEHLQMFIPMCLNLGLSGVAFTGPDIGGFSNECNGELLTRWYQAAIFTPFFRNHNCAKGDQEPWAFGPYYEKIIKKSIEIRYEYLPYLYQQFVQAHKTGLPIMRPLVIEYEEDPETYNLYDAYLVGTDILVAPILHPSKDKRLVYLPKGQWWYIHNLKLYSGEEHYIIEAPLDTLPFFVKDGSVIPRSKTKNSTAVEDRLIIFDVYASDKISQIDYEFYEDDGESFDYRRDGYIKLNVLYEKREGKAIVVISKVEGEYQPAWEEIQVNLVTDGALQIEVDNQYIVK